MSSGTAARSATPAAAWIDRQAASWRNACSIAPLIAATSRACVTFVSASRNASRRSLQSIGGNHPSAATVLPIGEAGAGGFEIRSLTNASFPFYGGWGSGAVVAHKEPPRLHRPPSAVARAGYVAGGASFASSASDACLSRMAPTFLLRRIAPPPWRAEER